MPKLPDEQATATDEVEPQTFEALPEGLYLGTLVDVEVREGQKGEYWSWKFGDLIAVEDDKLYPGHLWNNTSLSEAAAWKLKEAFDAFKVPANTDTDELIGQSCWLTVSQRVIERGTRMGEVGNNIERLMPIGADEEVPEPAASK